METGARLVSLTRMKNAWAGWSWRRRRMILMSSPTVTWSGIKNLVLSSTGSCFSPPNLSMMQGTLDGCSARICSTSFTLKAEKYFMSLIKFFISDFVTCILIMSVMHMQRKSWHLLMSFYLLDLIWQRLQYWRIVDAKIDSVQLKNEEVKTETKNTRGEALLGDNVTQMNYNVIDTHHNFSSPWKTSGFPSSDNSCLVVKCFGYDSILDAFYDLSLCSCDISALMNV